MDVQLPDNQPIPFRERLAEVLAEINQSAGWLAGKAGVERSTITRILNDERNPSPETLALLAPVLGMSVEQLVAGTDAAARVEGARKLVDRSYYEEAVHRFLEAEKKANDLAARLREVQESERGELERRRRAEAALEVVQRERDEAQRLARHHEHDALRYREGLERAVADVAQLQTQVKELAASIGDGKRTGRVAAILAGVAAAVSVANYLRNDTSAGNQEQGTPTKKRRRAVEHE